MYLLFIICVSVCACMYGVGGHSLCVAFIGK